MQPWWAENSYLKNLTDQNQPWKKDSHTGTTWAKCLSEGFMSEDVLPECWSVSSGGQKYWCLCLSSIEVCVCVCVSRHLTSSSVHCGSGFALFSFSSRYSISPPLLPSVSPLLLLHLCAVFFCPWPFLSLLFCINTPHLRSNTHTHTRSGSGPLDGSWVGLEWCWCAGGPGLSGFVRKLKNDVGKMHLWNGKGRNVLSSPLVLFARGKQETAWAHTYFHMGLHLFSNSPTVWACVSQCFYCTCWVRFFCCFRGKLRWSVSSVDLCCEPTVSL